MTDKKYVTVDLTDNVKVETNLKDKAIVKINIWSRIKNLFRRRAWEKKQKRL